jgi:hypothetical protein
MAQIMYTHVGKCKNDKIKLKRKEKKSMWQKTNWTLEELGKPFWTKQN